ncbi:unnamed protein product [Colias eurytheme]|nr:unnamed protein product [Colias eurytheme]
MPAKLGAKYKRNRRRALRELAGIQKRARSSRSEAERKRDYRARLIAAREMAVNKAKPIRTVEKRDRTRLKSVHEMATRKHSRPLQQRVDNNAMKAKVIQKIKKKVIPEKPVVKQGCRTRSYLQQKKVVVPKASRTTTKAKDANDGNSVKSSSPSPPSTSESDESERVEVIHVYLNL